MKKRMIFMAAVLLLVTGTLYAAYTYPVANIDFWRASAFEDGGAIDLWMTETEALVSGSTPFASLSILESTGTNYTKIIGGNQSAILTLTLPTAYAATTGYVLSSTDAGVLSWVANGGTFTGGSITSDVTLSNGVDIFSSTTTAHTNSIGGRDIDGAAYVDVLRWTNGNTVAAVLGSATTSLAVVSTGLNVSTGGAITGAAGVTNTGVLTSAGGATNLNTSGADAVNIGTGTYSGTATIGNNSASVAIATSQWDITGAGAMSGFSSLGLSGDITMATGKGVLSSTTTAETVGVYGYDNNGAVRVGGLVVTNGDTPTTVLGNANGTTAITSSDWAIGTTGIMTGMGAITSDGLFTGSLGATITGATVNLNASSNFAVNVATGTSTGTVTVGGDGTQAIDIGNGAGIKTVALGSSNTTSTTTILGGDNGVNINVDNLNNTTNINTSGSTGTVTVGGTGIMAINIGAGGTGAKTIAIGDGASTGTTTIKAGSGKVIINATNGTVATDIGTGNTTGAVTIGGTGTQAIDVGNGAGIKTVALGSNTTTSATTILSGTTAGALGLNVSAGGAVTNIGTGTTTGTVTIGGAGIQAIDIGTGAAAKTVTLGSTNTTSTTNIQAGSGGINITGNVNRTSQQYVQSIAYAKLGASGAGWVIGAADSISLATLPQSQTAENIVIPITIPLKVGWTITAFSLNGQIDSAGGAVTLDADLRKLTEATAGYADASIGAITQIAKTADYKVVDAKSSLAEVVAADESYYILVTGTTAATTDIEIASITITVTEL
jgi:hypothetical protein